jgi:hypothetical protein
VDQPEATLSDTGARAYLAVSGIALLYVLAAPFSVLISPEAVKPWYAGVAGLTCVAAALAWWRPRPGCFELFVPVVATVWVISFTAARPDVIGPWIPVVQGLAMVAIVLGYRVRRRSGGK